ncbi:hypothetical protein HPB50_014420 [Hyalomma asiaticum]|uniref:Uncharacterized protein n=1 Tax=Hyalomma asiaticum TaxID=266040 RepID=A0ACB7TI77_HYAAI|nr:hypothetical protein HPB50_014420 [Hyalomma asiaticum]
MTELWWGGVLHDALMKVKKDKPQAPANVTLLGGAVVPEAILATLGKGPKYSVWTSLEAHEWLTLNTKSGDESRNTASRKVSFGWSRNPRQDSQEV